MTIEQLKYFIDVVESKNMTISASKFYISPQGFSRSLKSLQKELNVELLKFSNGKIEITDEGKIYYTKIKDFVLKINQINEELIQSKTQKINIAVSSYTYRMISSLLAKFKEEHPEYILMIAEYPDKITESRLADSKADIAFITGPIFKQEVKYDILCEAESYVCIPCNHPFTTKDTIKFDDLKEEPFLTMNDEYKTHDCYVTHMKEKSYSPKIVFCASTLEGLKEALILHQGITIINPQYNICPKD
ncbi:MAG: LysR family transcriptional regulator, partial [Erysipelotrichaceae bacterium]|nr:LysR family transcriptional regulator [Erysipelotrichaceae bacterium]